MTQLVSIITPTYNSEKYIAETINSVMCQTHSLWEMIVVDDCSTDQTAVIVQGFALHDSRIKIINLNENSGTGIARNRGLQQAEGRYIAFLDADDLWLPNKLSEQIRFMQIKNLPFTFCFYDCIDENGNSLQKRIESPVHLTYKQLFFCNYIGNLTAIYDVDFFGKINISTVRKRQDWVLWLTILKKISVAQPVPESLARYRIHKNSVSASKLDLLQHNFKVYRSFHGLNLLISACCMLLFLCTQLLIKPLYIRKIR